MQGTKGYRLGEYYHKKMHKLHITEEEEKDANSLVFFKEDFVKSDNFIKNFSNFYEQLYGKKFKDGEINTDFRSDLVDQFYETMHYLDNNIYSQWNLKEHVDKLDAANDRQSLGFILMMRKAWAQTGSYSEDKDRNFYDAFGDVAESSITDPINVVSTGIGLGAGLLTAWSGPGAVVAGTVARGAVSTALRTGAKLAVLGAAEGATFGTISGHIEELLSAKISPELYDPEGKTGRIFEKAAENALGGAVALPAFAGLGVGVKKIVKKTIGLFSNKPVVQAGKSLQDQTLDFVNTPETQTPDIQTIKNEQLSFFDEPTPKKDLELYSSATGVVKNAGEIPTRATEGYGDQFMLRAGAWSKEVMNTQDFLNKVENTDAKGVMNFLDHMGISNAKTPGEAVLKALNFTKQTEVDAKFKSAKRSTTLGLHVLSDDIFKQAQRVFNESKSEQAASKLMELSLLTNLTKARILSESGEAMQAGKIVKGVAKNNPNNILLTALSDTTRKTPTLASQPAEELYKKINARVAEIVDGTSKGDKANRLVFQKHALASALNADNIDDAMNFMSAGKLVKTVDGFNSYIIANMLNSVDTLSINSMSGAVMSFYLPLERLAGGLITGNKYMLLEGAVRSTTLMASMPRAIKGSAIALVRGKSDFSKSIFAHGKGSAKTTDFLDQASRRSGYTGFSGRSLATLTKDIFLFLSHRAMTATDAFFKELVFDNTSYAKSLTANLKNNNGNLVKSIMNTKMDVSQIRFLKQTGKLPEDADPQKILGIFKQSKDEAVESVFQREVPDGFDLAGVMPRIFNSARKNTRIWMTSGTPGVNVVGAGADIMLNAMYPFLRTGYNLIDLAVRSTPLAPLSARFRQQIANGGDDMDRALGALGLGALVAGYGTYKFISGEYEAEQAGEYNEYKDGSAIFKDEDGNFVQRARPEGTLTLFGVDLQIKGITPLNSVMNMLPSFMNMIKNGNKETYDGFVAGLSVLMATQFNDVNFWKDSKRIVDFVSYLIAGEADKSEQQLAKIFKNKTELIIPFFRILQKLSVGEARKEAHTYFEYFTRNLPGYNNDIDPKRDATTGQITYYEPAVNGFYIKTPVATDNLNKLLAETTPGVNKITHKFSFKLPNGDNSDTIDLREHKSLVSGNSLYDELQDMLTWAELDSRVDLKEFGIWINTEGRTIEQSLAELAEYIYGPTIKDNRTHLLNIAEKDGKRDIQASRAIKKIHMHYKRKVKEILNYKFNRQITVLQELPDTEREALLADPEHFNSYFRDLSKKYSSENFFFNHEVITAGLVKFLKTADPANLTMGYAAGNIKLK